MLNMALRRVTFWCCCSSLEQTATAEKYWGVCQNSLIVLSTGSWVVMNESPKIATVA